MDATLNNVSRGVDPSAQIFVSEISKHLDITTDDVKARFAVKMLSTATSLANTYEQHVVNAVVDAVSVVKNLNKKVFLSQRLSDAEKSLLMQWFSPPYKLEFSPNPTDIGAHMFYRSLNEIATYRCYDLLPSTEKVPSGYNVLIKEVGASIPKIIKYGRKNVHACTPNLSVDDVIRATNTLATLDHLRKTGTNASKHLARLYIDDPVYRCFNKSQHCLVKAKYLVFAHSSYDCTLTDMANMMDAAGAEKAVGFIHYSSRILSNLANGSDNGLNWKLQMMNKEFFIVFWFDNDYQNSYVHHLDTYLGIVKSSVCMSRKNNPYIVQRQEEIGGILFYNILKPVRSIPATYSIRQIPFSDPDSVIIHYYNLQNDPNKYFYRELIPIRIVVKKKYFERLYYYLQMLPEGKFTVQNAVNMASTMASRTIVNGAYVTQAYDMSVEEIDNVAYATYFIVFCRRYDFLEVLKTLKNFEDIKRNPSFFDRIGCLLRKVRNYVLSSSFTQFKEESTFEEVIENGKKPAEMEHVMRHSNNVLQWLLKLFRINNRYDVKFFPITRVVSIEEDIETIRSVAITLPAISEDESSLREAIMEQLKITRVNPDLCVVDEHHCADLLYVVPNAYKEKCVLKCIANALNLEMGFLVNTLKNSNHLGKASYSLRAALLSFINGPVADIDLFELVACEFGIEICVHLDGKTMRYSTRNDQCYHFKVSDNHCFEMRKKCAVQPFEFTAVISPVAIDEALVEKCAARSRGDKYRMYPVVADYKPYVNRAVLKLHELDSAYGVLRDGNICELSAAPGSWLQYCRNHFSQSKLFYSHFDSGHDMKSHSQNTVLLNEITDGDLTNDDAITEIGENIEKHGGMDVLLCDVSIFDNSDRMDLEKFGEYLIKLFSCLSSWLNDGGNILIKMFADVAIPSAMTIVLHHFGDVKVVKPVFSSGISSEYYIVAKNFQPEGEPQRQQDYNLLRPAIITKLNRNMRLFYRNVYPEQISYELPRLFSYDDHSTPEPIQDQLSIMPDEPIEEPLDGDALAITFESEFIKRFNSMTPYDVPSSGFEVSLTSLDFNADVEVHCFETDLLNTNGEHVSYMFHNTVGVRVDISCTGVTTETLSRLSFVANKISMYRLKVYLDLTSITAAEKVRDIIALVKEKFCAHDVRIIANHIDCNYSLSKYKMAIVEYLTYNKSVCATQANAYRFYYGMLRTNDFQLSSSFVNNLSKDVQNIGVLLGDRVVFRHPKLKPDDYSHCFDGENFVKNANLDSGKYYLIGDYTYRMFDQGLAEAVSSIDIDALADVQFILVQGVAGHGKTREIVQQHTPKLRNSPVGDLVVTPTKAGKEVLLKRTMEHHKLDANNLDRSRYRTMCSYLLAKDVKSSVMYVDEVMMVHVAVVLACAYHCGAKRVYMYGDTQQIPAHSALGDFVLRFNTPLSLFAVKEVRDKSYRIPCDVAAVLNPYYAEAHSQFGFSKGLSTASTVLRSLKIVKIGSVSEMTNFINPDVKFLTFTHSTESELNRLGDFNPSTVAAYQGSESSHIAVVRTSYSPADKIYNDLHICITALTRHTKSFTYYTTCDADVLSRLVKDALAMTDIKIKSFGTSFNVGSIVVPTYGEVDAGKFFRSRKNFTHSFTCVDYRQFDSEKSLVLHMKNVQNDVFLDKRTFKTFSMSAILKWVRKLAPNIKYVYVKVFNEPFADNEQIKELVEDYKCANTVETKVTEGLTSLPSPEPVELVPLFNEISVAPCAGLLQVFMNHLFPNCVYVPTDHDAHFVHTSDLALTLSNVSVSFLWDRYTPKEYGFDKLRPILSTPCPATRDVSQREILLGIQKRNLNPPELITTACPEDAADHLVQNFCSKLMLRNFDAVIRDMEVVQPTTASIVNWLERQDRSVLSSLVNDVPFFLESLSNCSLSLKRNPKIRISGDCVDVYDSVQTITFHPKHINAYFCSVIESVQSRLELLLQPYVKFFTKVTTKDFGDNCWRAWNTHGKVYMFSGDDSLLMSGRTFKEMDMSKFDKSQLLFALLFLCKLLNRLGVPTHITQLYYEMMYFRICRDPLNKVTMFLTPQMESGCAATYFGNTTFCAAVIASCLDLDTFEYTPRFEKFSQLFNLETKEFDYQNPYFCSKFMVIDEHRFVFYPDPVKLLIKLGRKDLKNARHLTDFHTSMKDLISQYDSCTDVAMISAAIRERYGYPYDCSALILNLISVIKDKKCFDNLFYTLPSDRLDVNSENFSDL